MTINKSLTTIQRITVGIALLLAHPASSKPLQGNINSRHEMIPSEESKLKPTSLERQDLESADKTDKSQPPGSKPESTEIQLAWDAWHKRLAEAIYYRFDILAYQKFQDSPPFGVKIRYVVTKDGRIVGLKIIEKSSDMIFDALACQAIMWQARKPALLKFPEGSSRDSVEKFATFTQNMGEEGYQSTEGDKETVHVQQ